MYKVLRAIAFAIVFTAFGLYIGKEFLAESRFASTMDAINSEMIRKNASINKTVKSQIKVKKACVDVLELLEGEKFIQNMDKMDQARRLAERNFQSKSSTSMIDALINNAGVDLIEDQSLLQHLYAWKSNYVNYQQMEVEIKQFQEEYYRGFLLREFDLTSFSEDDKLVLYRSKTYRNFIQTKMEMMKELLLNGQSLKNQTQGILDELESRSGN